MSTLPLALLLLRASRWFDRRLLETLTDQGWPALSPAQSLVFAHLDADGTPLAELARRLGTTRQSTQDLVAGMVRHELLAVVPNPSRRGGRLVTLTDRGQHLAGTAARVLAGLESDLGGQRAGELRDLLSDFAQPRFDDLGPTGSTEVAPASEPGGALRRNGSSRSPDVDRPMDPQATPTHPSGRPGDARA